MISAMCQVYTKRGSESEGGNLVEKFSQKREETKREGRGEIVERRRRKGERKRERKEDLQVCPLIYRNSDGRSSLGRELKFVYSTRAMVQEVGILPPLVISALSDHLVGFLACDKVALFQPYILSGFWDWFSFGKMREFGFMSFK